MDALPLTELQFLTIAIDNWLTLVPLALLCSIGLWFSVRDRLTAGLLDPITLTLVFAFGINYGIVLFMKIEDLIDWTMFLMVAGYAILLMATLRLSSAVSGTPLIYMYFARLGERQLGGAVFAIASFFYGTFSLLIFWSIGFGILAETNRFDVARGYGAAIRIMDGLSPFIIAYAALAIIEKPTGRVAKFILLGFFILYAAIVNGAKASVIYSLSIVFLALSMSRYKIKISMAQAIMVAVVGLSFSAIALNINLSNNNVRAESSDPLAMSSNQVIARLAYRFIGFGDTSYLILPNRIIDSLQKDSIYARFLAPIVGNDNLGKVLGYEVADYSVGRQALLHYSPNSAVGGGPTSHFDLFAYVYFGPVGGILFVIFLGWLLGRINRAVRMTAQQAQVQHNKLLISLMAAIWARGVLVIIEPTVALAYIVDIIILFTAIIVMAMALQGSGSEATPGGPQQPPQQ